MKRQKIAIVGGTSAIAEHCSRLWLQQQATELTLIGRNAAKMQRVAADLQVRHPDSTIDCVQADFMDPGAIEQTVADLYRQGPIDIALIAHGDLPDQQRCQQDLQACRNALEINGISTLLYAEAFVQHMEKANHGRLGMIGSVAGDRGRKSNYVYGAAKGLMERYAQGLQHRLALAHSAVKVTLIKPGPTATPMTAGLEGGKGKLASPESVARDIVASMQMGKAVVYTPTKWRAIMQIIRWMPNLIFNRINI